MRTECVIPPRRLSGYLELEAEAQNGVTRLARKAFKTPVHISKPYWDSHSLLLNLMSPTAGLLEGDEVVVDVCVRQNASLTLSSPTALRIHKMEHDKAVWKQTFSVETNGFLEYNPEWLMLQGGSRLLQETEIDIAEGAELFFIESCAAGRVAHGEQFEFAEFANRFSLRYADRPASLERFRIAPQQSVTQPWIQSGRPFYCSLYLCSNRLSEASKLWDSIYEMNNSLLSIGCTPLAHGPCWNARLLSLCPRLIRHAISELRRSFYNEIQRPMSQLRR